MREEASAPSIQLDPAKSKVLVVEGAEDEMFFNALLKVMNLPGVQVINAESKDKIESRLRAIVSLTGFRERIDSVGIERDADESAEEAFAAVRKALAECNLSVPDEPLKPTGGAPQVCVMIVPPGRSEGRLEDVCLRAFRDEHITNCMDQYFACLGNKASPPARLLSKAKVNVYLSAMNPTVRLGAAARDNHRDAYWPWEHPAFNEVKQFLKIVCAPVDQRGE